MKKFFSAAAALMLALSSCVRDDGGRDISDYEGATTGDSLLYYYVQLRAHEYWEHSNSDTTLRSAEERKKFLDGIKAGVGAVRNDDRSYNQGVYLGTQMATKLQEFERLYGVEIDEGIIIESFRRGLRDGADIPELQYQDEFYRLLDELKSQLRSKEREKSKMTLIGEARDHRMTKISDNLYYRIKRKGSGPYAAKGDVIYIAVDYERADGQDLAMPSPEMITVGGAGVPEVMDSAYMRLNKGTTAIFATTAEAIFASRAQIMGMRPDDVVIVTITMNDIVRPNDPDNPARESEEDTIQ